MSTSPTVAVCVPLYDPDPSYLHALFASIATQRGPEVVVHARDDASPAGDAAGLARAVAAEVGLPIDARRGGCRLGAVANWNAVVAQSDAPLVMLVSQDDLLGPGMIGAYVAELADPGVVMVSGGELFIDGEGAPRTERGSVAHRHRVFVQHDRYRMGRAELTRLCLRHGQAFGEPSAVMFRRAAFDAEEGYDPAFAHAADVDLHLRLARHGDAVYLRHPHLRRRRHPAMLTVSHLVDGARAGDRRRLLARHGTDLDEAGRAEARAALALRGVLDLARATAARRRAGLEPAWQNVRLGAGAPGRAHLGEWRAVLARRNEDER